MLETDGWYSAGKQASRKSLRLEIMGVKTRSANGNTPRIVDVSDNAVQNDTLRAREGPALEDVRELLSSGNDAADAGDIAATSPPEQSDDALDNDPVIGSQDATSSETIATTGQTPGNDTSTDTEVVTLSEVASVADEATKTDNDVAMMQAVSGDADNILVDFNAKSTTANFPSHYRNEETVNTERVITVKDASTPSSSIFHSPSGSEALPIDNASVSLSALKDSPKALAEGRLVFQQSSLTPSANAITPKRTSPRKNSNPMSPHAMTTPSATRTPKLPLGAKLLRTDHAGETPQIGTSLLRRESLRRKESPSKKRDARTSKTPKKRDTLQRRDTLQEREILQKVIAESTTDHNDEILDALPIETSTLPSSNSAPEAEDNTGDNASGSSEPFLRAGETDLGTNAYAEADLPAIDETNVKKDLHRAMEAIEVYEHPDIADASPLLVNITPGDIQGMEAMDKANEVLAKTELDDVSQATRGVREQTANQKTRSGARFSDDTSMLKDFLNRAQARKAAQKPLESPLDAAITQHSPRRSPRKMHGSQDGQVPSPQKPRNIANRSNTPPSKPKTEAFDSDDGDEQNAEAASCRRSTRTRLPTPSKALPGAPSFIPVRRADGTDPVVLQKSQAQEVALTTRANTRRNKGQSKPPLLALQDLPSLTESTDVTSTGRAGGEKAKSVAWAERLASYRDAKEGVDEAEERRPKVRRLRGLGAGNGTPAATRTTAVVSTSNGTPAPNKRRGKL